MCLFFNLTDFLYLSFYRANKTNLTDFYFSQGRYLCFCVQSPLNSGWAAAAGVSTACFCTEHTHCQPRPEAVPAPGQGLPNPRACGAQPAPPLPFSAPLGPFNGSKGPPVLSWAQNCGGRLHVAQLLLLQSPNPRQEATASEDVPRKPVIRVSAFYKCNCCG